MLSLALVGETLALDVLGLDLAAGEGEDLEELLGLELGGFVGFARVERGVDDAWGLALFRGLHVLALLYHVQGGARRDAGLGDLFGREIATVDVLAALHGVSGAARAGT